MFASSAQKSYTSYKSWSYDILAISETCENDVKHQYIPNFNIYKTSRTNKQGGGTALFVKKSIPYMRFKICRYNNSIEFAITWIIIKPFYLPKTVIVIAIPWAYLPPTSNKATQYNFYESLVNAVDNIKQKCVSPRIMALTRVILTIGSIVRTFLKAAASYKLSIFQHFSTFKIVN